MKDKHDKQTRDLFEEPKSNTQYHVYLQTTDGTRIVWTHLTRRQALALHKLNTTNINPLQSSTEITRCGWEEL